MADPIEHIVVLIPGIGGSVLERDGKEVWAPRAGAIWRGLISRGKTIRELALDGDDPTSHSLGDGIEATELLPDLHIVPGLDWKIDGYSKIRRQLVTGLGLVPGENYFELPYDWRRDNRVAAARLAFRSERWLDNWRRQGHPDAKLILLGHSMGGVVARIYLELMEGWRETKSLVTFGTPYLGSVDALEFLANGLRKGIGPITIDLTETVRSMTSAYQLLPSYRCIEVDGAPDGVAYLDEIGAVPGLNLEDTNKLNDALTLQRQIRAAVDDHRSHDYESTGGYEIRPVMGNRQRTLTSGRIVDGQIETSRWRGGKIEKGDGTVPSISSVPHELYDGFVNATFSRTKHASMQNDDGVLAHIAGVVTSLETGQTVPILPLGDIPVELDVDTVLVGNPVHVRVRPEQPTNCRLRVERIGDATTATVALNDDPDNNDQLVARLDDWDAGEYRVTVEGDSVDAVTEIFAIVDPQTTN